MIDEQKPQTLYPNIYAIFTVLITMPVSSASSECSFSAMRRVKKTVLELQWVMRDYEICSEKKQTPGLVI
jgi:hypothetical protein